VLGLSKFLGGDADFLAASLSKHPPDMDSALSSNSPSFVSPMRTSFLVTNSGHVSSNQAWWQSGLMRKTRNLVPSGASVRIRPTSIFFAILPITPYLLFDTLIFLQRLEPYSSQPTSFLPLGTAFWKTAAVPWESTESGTHLTPNKRPVKTFADVSVTPLQQANTPRDSNAAHRLDVSLAR
jgi:hypothetical protein